MRLRLFRHGKTMRNREKVPDIALLLTGNELISGELTDTNAVYLARKLADAGAMVRRKLVVGDCADDITDALVFLSRAHDIVIVNGGLGSTVDDLTAAVAATVSGKRLVERPEAIAHIAARFGGSIVAEKSPYFAQLRKQALIPEGAGLLDNPVGLALGFRLVINDALCFFTPGVPAELQAMFQQSILPEIRRQFQLQTAYRTYRLQLVGIGESQIQQLINQHLPKQVLQAVQLGFRAQSSIVELKMTIDDPTATVFLEEAQRQVRSLMAEFIFSETGSLPEALIDLLRTNNRRLVLAESCTGGLIASRLTAVPGASDVFEAGIVSYSNESKQRILTVSREEIDACGAVSEEVACAMVSGALKQTDANIGAAVTGIAGPGGGTAEKPVGTVYLAWGQMGDIRTRLMQVKRDRTLFQHLVCTAVMDILRRYLLGLNTDTVYYFDDVSRRRFLEAEGDSGEKSIKS